MPNRPSGTHLGLYEPALLPASSIAGLKDVCRVDGDAVMCVVQRGKVVLVVETMADVNHSRPVFPQVRNSTLVEKLIAFWDVVEVGHHIPSH